MFISLIFSGNKIPSEWFCLSVLQDGLFFTAETLRGILLFSTKTTGVVVKGKKYLFAQQDMFQGLFCIQAD